MINGGLRRIANQLTLEQRQDLGRDRQALRVAPRREFRRVCYVDCNHRRLPLWRICNRKMLDLLNNVAGMFVIPDDLTFHPLAGFRKHK